MKVCSLYGASASYDNGLNIVMKIVYSTLLELGVETEEINLIEYNIPYFIGMKTEPVRIITDKIKKSDSVIFATPSQMFQPSAIMKCLLDYFEMDEYKNLLQAKNCMIVTISNKYGERETADYISRIIDLLGGNEATRIAFGGSQRAAVGQSTFIQEVIEKQVEDYYRVFRQNKKYFCSSESEFYSGAVNSKLIMNTTIAEDSQPVQPIFTQPTITQSISTQPKTTQLPVVQPKTTQLPVVQPKTNILTEKLIDTQPQQAEEKSIFSELNDILGSLGTQQNTTHDLIIEQPQELPNEIINTYTALPNKTATNFQPVNYDAFTSRQEEDIKELSKLFSQQAQSLESNIHNTPVSYGDIIRPREKTIKQLTFSLPHYFQPQLATDINAVIQINITGDETFECYISILGMDCQCTEGVYLTPSLTILSSTSVWNELLKGKYSAQKAFMTGQLKVRGDFLLLNKFDQIFKKM